MVVVPTFAPAGVAAKVKGKPGEMACVVDPPLVGSLIAAGCKFAHPDFSLLILGNTQAPPHCAFAWRQWGASRYYPDRAKIRSSGVVESALRRFQPRLRAVERTERSVAKVSAPAWVRKPPDIFIFTFIMRMSCSA